MVVRHRIPVIVHRAAVVVVVVVVVVAAVIVVMLDRMTCNRYLHNPPGTTDTIICGTLLYSTLDDSENCCANPGNGAPATHKGKNFFFPHFFSFFSHFFLTVHRSFVFPGKRLCEMHADLTRQVCRSFLTL